MQKFAYGASLRARVMGMLKAIIVPADRILTSCAD